MMKFFITVLILISCAVFASAQSDCNETPITFEPSSEEFSFESPQKLVLIRFSSKDKDSTRLYKNSFCGAYFFISSEKNIASSQYKRISQLAAENQTEVSIATVNNFDGRKFSFEDSEGFYQTVLAVQGNKRFYIFHTVSATKDNPAVENFFKSIKFDKSLPLRKLPETETKTSVKSSSSEKQENKSSASENRLSGGIGSGSGIGIGSGSRISSSSSIDSKSNNQTIPIKILVKIKPEYTELARFYEISGTVLVRVTFLANGKIGAATPVSKLPLGLTNSAIEAAKKLQFEPQIREGTPVTVVKTIQYQFTIY